MYYIFSADRRPLAKTGAKPNLEELTTRGEIAVEHDGDILLLRAELIGDRVQAKAEAIATAEEAAAAARAVLRTKRDRLLSACDWTQLADAPITSAQKAEWQVYRQELRDLPENTMDPAAPSWPVPPE